MKYRDLIQFDPIETVIQINQADQDETARHLVSTYVLSSGMARQLNDRVLPNLQFDQPADNKGVLVVGNYGTGKSHLLSFLSIIAENASVLAHVRNQKAIPEAQQIAGRFKVARLEIGATTKGLRDIICGKLEDSLEDWGVSFQFPAASAVTSNKDALVEMMGRFAERYPEHGLLLVVDELLDYLRSRNEQAIVLDLSFLRELGESCKLFRFRFIAGLQESLFDNPRFQFVGQSLLRVKDRFETMRIVREDVAHVVAERLLAKTAVQKGKIRTHLEKFTALYNGMAERLEDFVRLFPIHPTYLEVFEALSIAEKREVLKTFSRQMRTLLDHEVPAGEPGLLSYDAYWRDLKDNTAVRSIPEVQEVLDKGQVLESRIEQAFPQAKKVYKPMAVRILNALAVHRLTTDDIRAPIGPTTEELRDGLCLYLNLPEKTSDFLKSSIASCLKETMRTMNGQFISYNPDNDQYYLDLKKDIDHDARIEERAGSLSENQLDRYFFDALTQVLERADQTTYVRDYRIWEYELDWVGHKMFRRGYLFFGAPNERSTAKPPRDFYLYFLQLFEVPLFADEKKADEVFFILRKRDDPFLQALRLYAGAREMSVASTAAHRKVYDDKAAVHLRALVDWLRKHMLSNFEVVHKGVARPMLDWLRGSRTGDATVQDLVDQTGSVALSASFDEMYPDYPRFNVKLTTRNLRGAVEEAIRCLAAGSRSQLANALLDGLGFFEGDKLRPQRSPYCKGILEKLHARPRGQVINRKELLVLRNGSEIEAQHRLEPEMLAVLLVGLVQSGDITISLPGRKLDASNLAESARTPVDQLLAFKHIERPIDFPLAEWVAVLELLDLPAGLVRQPEAREQAVVQLRPRVDAFTNRVVMMRQLVQSGLPCWGGDLLPPDQRDGSRKPLDDLQAFLEKLQPFNTVGKMNNLQASTTDVEARKADLAVLAGLEALHGLAQGLAPLTSYLTTAAALLPQGDSWRGNQEQTRAEWQARLLDPAQRSAPDFRGKLLRVLARVKDDYRKHYLTLHKKARLGTQEDSRKKALLGDQRLKRLSKLTAVSLLPHGALGELQQRLARLQTCFSLVEQDLETAPQCPHCSFRPLEEGQPAPALALLQQIDEQIDRLIDGWTRTLLDNLADPTAQQSIELLPAEQKRAVQTLLRSRELPATISNDLVQGIQCALAGLTAIPVEPAALLAALASGADPCTVEQLRQRFEEYLERLLYGKDVQRVRLLVHPATREGQP